MSIQFVNFESPTHSSATQHVTFLEGSTSHSIQEVVFWPKKEVSPEHIQLPVEPQKDSTEHTKSFLSTWLPCFYKT